MCIFYHSVLFFAFSFDFGHHTGIYTSVLCTRTFENVDSVIRARQFKCQRRVMRLENAQVIVQNGQLVPRVAQETA